MKFSSEVMPLKMVSAPF